MRLKENDRAQIKKIVFDIAGEEAKVFLFGSRVEDSKAGGDVDLLVQLPGKVDNPALLSAQLSARVSRLMSGRKTDVLLSASNLKDLPIHQLAKKTGIML